MFFISNKNLSEYGILQDLFLGFHCAYGMALIAFVTTVLKLKNNFTRLNNLQNSFFQLKNDYHLK